MTVSQHVLKSSVETLASTERNEPANMNNRIIILAFICCALFLGACSYYGSNTYLSPDTESNIICSGVEIEIYPILIDRKKTAHAFAGIPYFPSIVNSKPSEIGEVHIWYQNIGKNIIGNIDDISLSIIGKDIAIFPTDMWKSKVVEKYGIRYIGCVYKFEQLDKSEEYQLMFREDFLKCNTSPVLLHREKRSGYHQVFFQ